VFQNVAHYIREVCDFRLELVTSSGTGTGTWGIEEFKEFNHLPHNM